MVNKNHEKKLSKVVKQNSPGSLLKAKFEAKEKWQRVDSNHRPKAYESSALPLSYAASKLHYTPRNHFLANHW